MAANVISSFLPGASSFLPNNSNPQWGLYGASGGPVLVANAVAGIEYAHDWRISDYPQEQGAFASYNKVQVPFTAKVQYLIADPQIRQQFLRQAEVVCASLNFVAVITPDIPYLSANPVHAGYRRTSRNGVTLVLVEVWCEEVRLFGSTTTANTASPNGTSPVSSGVVQAGPGLTDGAGQVAGTGATSTLSTGLAPPTGIGPETTITAPQLGPDTTYQYQGLTPPLTDNFSFSTSDTDLFP